MLTFLGKAITDHDRVFCAVIRILVHAVSLGPPIVGVHITSTPRHWHKIREPIRHQLPVFPFACHSRIVLLCLNVFFFFWLLVFLLCLNVFFFLLLVFLLLVFFLLFVFIMLFVVFLIPM